MEQLESQETYQKLVAKLKQEGVKYQELTHEPVLTSEEAANVRKDTLASGAKAICVKAGKPGRFYLFVMSASEKMENQLIKEIVKEKRLSFATANELQSLTNCVTGAVPPFGSLFGLSTYMDESLQT